MGCAPPPRRTAGRVDAAVHPRLEIGGWDSTKPAFAGCAPPPRRTAAMIVSNPRRRVSCRCSRWFPTTCRRSLVAPARRLLRRQHERVAVGILEDRGGAPVL